MTLEKWRTDELLLGGRVEGRSQGLRTGGSGCGYKRAPGGVLWWGTCSASCLWWWTHESICVIKLPRSKYVQVCTCVHHTCTHTHTCQFCSLCSLTSYLRLSSLQSGFCRHFPTYTSLLDITTCFFDAKYTESFSALIFLEPPAAFTTVDTISLKCFLLLASVTLHAAGFPSYPSTQTSHSFLTDVLSSLHSLNSVFFWVLL